MTYRGTSLIRVNHPSEDHRRTLGIVLLYGPRRGVLLMSEVPLYRPWPEEGIAHPLTHFLQPGEPTLGKQHLHTNGV